MFGPSRFLVVASLLLCAGAPPGQTVIFVDAWNPNCPGSGTRRNPFCTIQAGINAAVDGDEVVVANGTYTGPGNVNLDYNGRLITLRSASGDPTLCIIDCENLPNTRGFHFHSGETDQAVVAGFTIRNGSASGGGIRNSGSSPTVTNCTLSGNSAPSASGGGMRNSSSSPIVTNCTFIGNSASSGAGGGMFNTDLSSPIVTNCTFIGNSAPSGSGGGMFNSTLSSPIVTNCTFIGNSQNGMFNSTLSSPTVTNCAFIENTRIGGSGGGMSNSDLSSPIVTNCTFIGNSTPSGRGGGMFNSTLSIPTLTNCTFSGNSAPSGSGGGMYNSDLSSPILTNCTFSGNSQGGMFNSSLSSPTVTNCILWGDTPNEFVGAGSPAVNFSNVQGGFPGTGNIDAEPLFIDADGPDDIPGTLDDDLRLSSGSPCIDAGDNSAVPADTLDLDGDGDSAEPIPIDLDGHGRIRDGDADQIATVDMGAYEFGPPCPADLNNDGIVEAEDLRILLDVFGTTDPVADVNNDGVVNVIDLIDLLLEFGHTCL